MDRSHAPRGHAAPDALRPAGHGHLEGDAERHWMRYHAERGNDQKQDRLANRASVASRLALRWAAKRPQNLPMRFA
ncbi:hypothetical protein DJ480_30600 [Pseudomonas sp. Leaf98]|nr:hypothetical protein DJ480_30600 [Pseudomonas sp. Leaf98]